MKNPPDHRAMPAMVVPRTAVAPAAWYVPMAKARSRTMIRPSNTRSTAMEPMERASGTGTSREAA